MGETVAELRQRLQLANDSLSPNRAAAVMYNAWPAIDALLARLAAAEANAEVRSITHPCPVCDAAAARRRTREWERPARSDAAKERG